jgi:hypothetical protein
MAKLIYKLNSVPDDEADDIKSLLSDNKIAFYETPPGNWGVSLHALWLNDEDQYIEAKQLIDEYQLKRVQRATLETSQETEQGEVETLIQRLLNRPFQFISLLAIVFLVLYLSIIPFLEFGQD